MSEIIETVFIAVISIVINSLSYYFLLDKHKKDKKKKEDYPFIKSLNVYSLSILFFVIIVALAYYLNIFALELTSLVLMVTTVLFSYLLSMVVSIVHANMTVEFIKYLIRENEKEKRIIAFLIHNLLILGVTYASIHAFIPLLDYSITNIIRIIMLITFILSFTIVVIYKEIKPFINKKASHKK